MPEQPEQNTTKNDATDLGVPMLPGDPSEPVGPEDALGAGPKRGDYSNRLGGADYQPHETVPVSDPEPGAPKVEVIDQVPRASERGEVAGKKGGVNSADDNVNTEDVVDTGSNSGE